MIPKECEPINVKIQELNAQKKELQADLPGLSGAQKWALLQQISALQHKITTLKNELNSCILRGGGKLPLYATFHAAFTLRTSYPDAKGPFFGNAAISVWFNETRTMIQITKFPPFKTPPFDTPVGDNTTTVTMSGGGIGSFDSANGSMNLPIQLYLDQSIDIPFYTEDSSIPFNLTTGSVKSSIGNLAGSPLDAQGHIKLVGASTFSDGVLDKSIGTIEISGLISPHP